MFFLYIIKDIQNKRLSIYNKDVKIFSLFAVYRKILLNLNNIFLPENSKPVQNVHFFLLCRLFSTKIAQEGPTSGVLDLVRRYDILIFPLILKVRGYSIETSTANYSNLNFLYFISWELKIILCYLNSLFRIWVHK